MFISKMKLSRRMMLRGMGATLSLPLLEAMVPALTAAPKPITRFGAIFTPLGQRPGYWEPKTVGKNFEFNVIMKPAEQFRDHMTVVTELCDPLDGHATTVSAWLSGQIPVPDDRREREVGHHDRPGHREQDRPGQPAALARAGDRGLHRLDWRLRHGVQLRLHEHDLVEERDDAAADGNQPAHRVRAAVRAAGHGAAARRADARQQEHPRLGARGSARPAEDAGRQGPGAAQRLPGQRARDRSSASRRPRRTRRPSQTVPDAPIGIPDTFDEHAAPDVRPGRRGVRSQHDARVHVHEVARRQPARVPEHRRQRAAPRDVAPRQQPGQDRGPREAQHVLHEPVREVPRTS